MQINVNNYSLYCRRHSPPEQNTKLKFTSHYGCNAFIRRVTDSHLYIVIPKDLVDIVLTEINKKSVNIYDLDKVLSLFEEMTFHYKYEFIDEVITFHDRPYKGYYLFTLTNYTNKITRYFAFCMIRHFYYYENILVNYVHLHEKCDNELEKIISLYLCSVASLNVFMGSLPLNCTTFKEVISAFKFHNQPRSKAACITIPTLENVKFIHENLSKINNICIFDKSLKIFKKDISEVYSDKIINKKLKSLTKVSYSLYNLDKIMAEVETFSISEKKKVLLSPIKINIKKTSLNGYNVLYLNEDCAINLDKNSRKSECLNDYKIVNQLKKSKFLNALCNQTEDITEDYNTHYLFFTKDRLFLHQVEDTECIIDSSFSSFDKYKLSEELLAKFHNIFIATGLDIGVIKVKISKDNYYVTEIKPFISNGDYCLTTYIKELSNVWTSRILS